MSKSRKNDFETILKEAGEQASSRAQEAIKRGVTFEYFKNIADNMVIPEYGSVLAGNVKTNNVKKVSKLKKSK